MLRPDGTVLQTAVMQGGQQPTYVQQPLVHEPVPPPILRTSGLAVGGAALLTGATALALYGYYVQAPQRRGDLMGVYRANRVMVRTSIGLGVASLGLNIGAVIQGQY